MFDPLLGGASHLVNGYPHIYIIIYIHIWNINEYPHSYMDIYIYIDALYMDYTWVRGTHIVSSQELPRWSVPCQWIRPGSSSWTVQRAVQSGDGLPELHDKNGRY